MDGRLPLRGVIALVAVLLLVAPGATAESISLEDPVSGAKRPLETDAVLHHVVFLATWCPECLDELPRLAELEARWRVSGYRLTIVAVAARQDPERLQRFLRTRTVPGRLLYDAFGEAERVLRPAGLPTHIVLDGEGNEIARGERLGAVERAIQGVLSKEGG